MEQDEFAAWYHENERRARAVDMLEKLQLLVADAAALYHAADARLREHLARIEQEQQRPHARQLETLVLEVDGARAVLVRAFQLRRVLQQQVRHLMTTRDEQEETHGLNESSKEQEETMEDADAINEALASINWEQPESQEDVTDDECPVPVRDAVELSSVSATDHLPRWTVSRVLLLLPLTLLVAVAAVAMRSVWT